MINILLYGAAQGGRQRVFVAFHDGIVFLKRFFTHGPLGRFQQGAERTLGQLYPRALFIGDLSELHIGIAQLIKYLGRCFGNLALHGEQAFFRWREDVGTVPQQALEHEPVFLKQGMFQEGCHGGLRDCLYFRIEIAGGLTNARGQKGKTRNFSLVVRVGDVFTVFQLDISTRLFQLQPQFITEIKGAP